MFVDVPPMDVVVLTFVPASRWPLLVSTDRHITQGWVDLKDLSQGGSEEAPTLSGRSRVIGGDRYTLTVGFPPGGSGMRLAAATARGREGELKVGFESHLGSATVWIDSPQTQEVTWELRFEAADTWVYPPRRREGVEAIPAGPGMVRLTWSPEYYSIAGYQVEEFRWELLSSPGPTSGSSRREGPIPLECGRCGTMGPWGSG